VTQLPNVRYLTGFSGSNGQILVTVDPERSLFFTDGRYGEQSRREVEGLERRVSGRGLVREVADACVELGLGRIGFEGAGVTYERYTDLAAGAPVELVCVNGAVEGQRMAKDPDELERIERAQACADEAFELLVPHALREGITERDLALELEIEMRRSGADDVGFEPIVAFGENGAEPHHEPTHRALRRGDAITMDFGARIDGYHSDMTRTIAFGEPGTRIRDVHDVVLEAQRAGVAAVVAGGAARDVDAAARGVIAEAGLVEAFSHPVGHAVGLEIHEAPIMRSDCEDRLRAGAVVTVEPGVYIPGVGGVRIEDMVLVTGDGARVIPRTTKELIVV
jgi:Xaa-Pro aminopeptidase